ncbi:hypothetical protein BGZ76_011746 [Entomortierella beljakovae]|nr:hypothetical protein BGZ76_011746 [Entomortierella beljakovae]
MLLTGGCVSPFKDLLRWGVKPEFVAGTEDNASDGKSTFLPTSDLAIPAPVGIPGGHRDLAAARTLRMELRIAPPVVLPT